MLVYWVYFINSLNKELNEFVCQIVFIYLFIFIFRLIILTLIYFLLVCLFISVISCQHLLIYLLFDYFQPNYFDTDLFFIY